MIANAAVIFRFGDGAAGGARVRRLDAEGGAARTAEAQFARWRQQTSEAIEVLAGSGALVADRWIMG